MTEERPRPLKDNSTEELLIKYTLFSSMNLGLANVGISVMERLEGLSARLDKAFAAAFKHTAGRIFFGGETLEEAEVRCASLLGKGTGVIIDYAAPEDSTGLTRDHYTKDIPERLKNTIAACGRLKEVYPKQTAALAIKISTLEDAEFLRNASKEIRAGRPLEGALKTQYDELTKTFLDIVHDANEKKVKVYVDAEKTEINDLIRDLCFKATKEHGLKLAMTLQCYLQETPRVVEQILAIEDPAKRPDIKLVRGAYMGKDYEDEKQYIWCNAREEGKAETDKCYNKAFRDLYGNVGEITAATHNQQSMTYISDIVSKEKNPNTKVDSATLLGMGDGIIGSKDIPRLKYVPYGKEHRYLARRGTEFAQSPVMDEDGKMTTRGRVESRWVRNELMIRAKGEPDIRDFMNYVDRENGQARQ